MRLTRTVRLAFTLLVAARVAGAQGGVLLQGVVDAEFWRTDSGSVLLTRNHGKPGALGRLQLWTAAEPLPGLIFYGQGQVEGGPPVRPLDRFYTRVTSGRVEVGKRFSLNSQLHRFPHPRDPSNHLDGLWQYLYPGRPTT